ncbi:hypothetical protein [Lyngbya confervoides]|uniref:ABC transporter permease n=1 Tax=Lyngbya confervoides BDU141951 TaxID=1574623 RepID=A0ABD4T712_9CYAN|nr:hypothetical protein [Lyngbya confervoides]MCM1984057.1 hypothetical protein [Lyngbya confervoides BDU141951]
MLLFKGLIIWLLFIVVEILNGTIRTLWLIPILGQDLAYGLSFGMGALSIVAIATGSVSWLRATRMQQLALGLLWVSLTLTFEVGLGRWGWGYSWAKIWSDYDLSQGGLMALGLLLVLISPWLGHQLRASTQGRVPSRAARPGTSAVEGQRIS